MICYKDSNIDTLISCYLISLYLGDRFKGYDTDENNPEVIAVISKDSIEVKDDFHIDKTEYVSLSKVLNNKLKLIDNNYINRIDAMLTSGVISNEEDRMLYQYLINIASPYLIGFSLNEQVVSSNYIQLVQSLINQINNNSYVRNEDSKIVLLNYEPKVLANLTINISNPVLVIYRTVAKNFIHAIVNCSDEVVTNKLKKVFTEDSYRDNAFEVVITYELFDKMLSDLDEVLSTELSE